MSLALSLAIGAQRSAISSDPRQHAALRNGGIWLPDEGLTTAGNGDRTWASQAVQPNSFLDLHTGNKPVPTTAINGAAVWDYQAAGLYSTWHMPTTGTALNATAQCSYAGWFRMAAHDTTSRMMWVHGWEDPGNYRAYARKNLGVGSLADEPVIEVTWDGVPGALDATAPAIGSRAKFNGPALVFDLNWHFHRWTYDISKSNYSIAGANHSDRIQWFIDEERVPDVGFSAPQSDSGGAAPDGPVRGPGLWPGSFLTLAGSHSSSVWNGEGGPFYIANGTLSTAAWRAVMTYKAPA